jgi:hypothetical protein
MYWCSIFGIGCSGECHPPMFDASTLSFSARCLYAVSASSLVKDVGAVVWSTIDGKRGMGE